MRCSTSSQSWWPATRWRPNATLLPAVVGVRSLFAFYVVGAVRDNMHEPGSRPYTDLVYVGLKFGGTWGVVA